MRVAEIGDHNRCCVPGGRSLVTMGMPGVTNTSQFSGMSRVLRSVITLSPLLARLRVRRVGGATGLVGFDTFDPRHGYHLPSKQHDEWIPTTTPNPLELA